METLVFISTRGLAQVGPRPMNTNATDSNLYFAKSTSFGIDWRTHYTTKEQAFERAQWFIRQWTEIGVEVSARVFYRDGSPVADFSSSVHQGLAQMLDQIEV